MMSGTLLSTGLPKRGSDGSDPTTCVYQYRYVEQTHLMLSAWNDAQFRKLCDVPDIGHIGADPHYQTRPKRAAAFGELTELFDGLLGGRTAA